MRLGFRGTDPLALLLDSLHLLFYQHKDKALEAQLAGVRFVLEELVHFLRDAQIQSNRYLPHILDRHDTWGAVKSQTNCSR